MTTGNEFFGMWQTARLADKHRKPMGASGLQQSELVWRQWLLFCAKISVDWTQAQASEVGAFVGDIDPRTKRANRKVSPVTVKRYWRILHDLYAHAVLTSVISDNPTMAARPPASERTPSLALTPNMWIQLQDGLPGGHVYQDRRNRLVLLLLMRCALTVSELIGLKTSSVTPHDGSPDEVSQRLSLAGLPLLQAESPFWMALAPHPIYALQVEGARAVQKRQLVLDVRTSQALHGWLEIRLPETKRSDGKLVLGDSVGQGITAKGLYNICHAHLQKCLAPANAIFHLGPNTLRNTCICIWRNQGVTADEILRRCGLKDAGVLERLHNHLHPSVYL
jgi:integrase/recombinase XerC